VFKFLLELTDPKGFDFFELFVYTIG
jgi:hypothetical protein